MSAIKSMDADALTPSAVLRCIVSLAAAQLKKRANSFSDTPEQWDRQTRLYASDTGTSLEADSLTVMNLAISVNTLFQIADSGLEDGLLRARTLGDWVDVVMRSREQGARALAFTSSGSTGEPTLYRHEWADLLEEIEELTPYLEVRLTAGIGRIVVGVPTHHIYGFLFGALLPAVCDVPVVDGARAVLAIHAGRLSSHDLVIGFPWLWQMVADGPAEFPPSVVGLSSTGPLPGDIGPRLKNRGLRELIEIHGSSETAGIGWRDCPNRPYRLMDRWRRSHDDDCLVRCHDRARSVAMPDRIEWVDENHYWPRGRSDHAVQVAGYNVYPDAIAQTIAAHPEVDQASVRLMRAGEGDRLKAYIVPSNESAEPAALRRRIDDWCRDKRLTSAETPARITIGSMLPRNTIGKLADW